MPLSSRLPIIWLLLKGIVILGKSIPLLPFHFPVIIVLPFSAVVCQQVHVLGFGI